MDFPSYVSGFIDGEGCFSVSFNFREKLNTKIEVRPSFSIGQNMRSLDILKKIQKFFGCGSIRFCRNDQCYKYETRNIDDLRNHIIPHFRKFPLMTIKKADFEIFSEICDKIVQLKHLNPDYLREIIDLAYKMNGYGKRKYKKEKLLSTLDKLKI